VLGLAWYLVGVTTIGLAARITRQARLLRVADALTVPMVRRLLQGALGLGLATAMIGAATPAGPGGPTRLTGALASAEATQHDHDHRSVDEVRLARVQAEDDEVTLRRADAGGTTPEPPLVAAPRDRPAPFPIERLRDAEVREATDPAAAAAAAHGDEEGADDLAHEMILRRVLAEDGTATIGTHEVVAGESLWTIAADTLVADQGGTVDDAQVGAYWRQLIDTNRDRLADPHNPDLIFPGQVVELPPVPGEGRP
jgi:nucleoid-associated protein YgaU